MSTRLDRNKPFGEIFGTLPENPTAKYTQNGHYFAGDGSIILNAEEKVAMRQKLAAELAALEESTAPAPVAPPATGPVAETNPLPTLPTEPAPTELTPQQKAAATRAANKAAKASALPPLPE